MLPTLFYTAYVCSPIYSALRQLGICRPILEVGGSPGDLQYPGYSQRVDRNTIHFTYPSLSKGLLMVGSMVRFPVHKGYFGKPAHHTGVSTLSWLLISKLLNPQPAAPGQDALGLITIYPRPDEHRILLQHSADADRSPAKNTLLTHPHTTINKRGSQQHTQKNNWITVYPFTHSVTGKPLFCSNRRMGAATSSSHPSILFAGGEYDILNLLSKRRISCRQRV